MDMLLRFFPGKSRQELVSTLGEKSELIVKFIYKWTNRKASYCSNQEIGKNL